MSDSEEVLVVFNDKRWRFFGGVKGHLPEISDSNILHSLRILRRDGYLEVRKESGLDEGVFENRTLEYRITEKGENRVSTNVTVKADYGSQYEPNSRYDSKTWYFDEEEDVEKLFNRLVGKGEISKVEVEREESFTDQRNVFKTGGSESLATVIPKKHILKLCLQEKDKVVFYYDENLKALLVRKRKG